MKPAHCLSYQHIGQHGTCDPEHLINNSTPAAESQYQGLKTELESIGCQLNIVTRQGAKDLEARKQKLGRECEC